MGPALNTASSMNAYILADRGTWLSFKNRGDLAIVVQGDQKLFNHYGVMLVNPAKHPHVKKAEGRLHRLDRVARRPGGDRRLQGRRRAAVLPEREEMIRRQACAPTPMLALATGSGLAAAAYGFSLPQ